MEHTREIIHAERKIKDLQNDCSLLQNIIESISDKFMTLDKSWQFVYVNQGAKQHLDPGHERQLVGEKIWELFPQLLGTKFHQSCRKVMEERIPLSYEAPSAISDTWHCYYIYPSENGITIFFNDISCKKAAEAKLVESRKLFLTSFNASPNMMSIISLDDLTYRDVNDTWLEKIGYQRREVVGKSISEIALFDSKRSNYIINKLREQGSVLNEEATVYTRNKAENIIGLVSAVVTELDEEQIIVTTINDITQLIEYEREIKFLDSLRLVGEMASGISHEIRNPLTTVRGFLQLLGGKEENAKYLSYYELMLEELDRVNSIISEYLSLAKNKKVERVAANLTNIVENMLPLIEADALRNDHRLKIDLQQVPDLLLDQKEIRQLLLNLVRNGLEATEQGGTVSIMTYHHGNEVVLAVRDTGCGISKEAQRKIGTPFFTTKEKGTGLGLSVCHSIVRRHNGILDFETGPNGTTFYVKFKVA